MKLFTRCGWVVAALLVTPIAHAEYPDRPVKVVLGLAAGGGADVLTRWYVDKLRQVSGTSLKTRSARRAISRPRQWPKQNPTATP